jgi:hypothetical protein
MRDKHQGLPHWADANRSLAVGVYPNSCGLVQNGGCRRIKLIRRKPRRCC